jgi:hypothetical protein
VTIVIGSAALGFATCTVNVNVPPGSTRLDGLGVFVTAIAGAEIEADSFAALHVPDTGG